MRATSTNGPTPGTFDEGRTGSRERSVFLINNVGSELLRVAPSRYTWSSSGA